MTTQDNHSKMSDYDVLIVGGGASGTSLLYTLSRYTNIGRLALIEKYDKAGQVNSKATNNSQTLHVGDIETNYSIEKAKQVKTASMMVARYADNLPISQSSQFLFKVPKMVLAVGQAEVDFLEKRYQDLLPIFPELQKLDRKAIAEKEPNVILGRPETQPVISLYNPHGYAVNFEKLSESFIDESKKFGKHIDVRFNSQVLKIEKNSAGHYNIELKDGTILTSRTVVVDADSYSLLFAKSLGYGQNYSLIPIAGTFYFSKELLTGKVYTVQEPKLPFAAVHGDPDVGVSGVTRWGPTARFHPVLESRNFKTSYDYLRSSGLNRFRTWISFVRILLDPTRFIYLLKNMLYELPWIGDRLFISNVRKIIPSIKARDVWTAKDYGGMRLQRVDTKTHELQLGEGKIIGDNIIFNMTPSPGASVCLYNARRDAETLMSFLGSAFRFDSAQMEKDLVTTQKLETLVPVSLPEGYAS